MLWKILLVLLYCLSCCEVLQVFRSLESWASNDFQGTPRIHRGEVFYVHQVVKQNHSCCFPAVIELWSFKTGSGRRNWVPGHLGDGEAKISSHPVDWACLRVLSWPQRAARVQRRLFHTGQWRFELPTLCTGVSVHTAVPGTSQHDYLLLYQSFGAWKIFVFKKKVFQESFSHKITRSKKAFSKVSSQKSMSLFTLLNKNISYLTGTNEWIL